MKIDFKLLPLLMLILIFITSCSVEKRIYRPGFNIEWNISKKAENKSPIEHKNMPALPGALQIPEKRTEFDLKNMRITPSEKNASVNTAKSKSESKVFINVAKKDKSGMTELKSDAFKSTPVNAPVSKIVTASNENNSSKRNIGLQYRLLVLTIAGFGIQKVATAIQQSKKGDGTSKKKTPVWLWIVLIVVLIVAAGSLAMTLTAV